MRKAEYWNLSYLQVIRLGNAAASSKGVYNPFLKRVIVRSKTHAYQNRVKPCTTYTQTSDCRKDASDRIKLRKLCNLRVNQKKRKLISDFYCNSNNIHITVRGALRGDYNNTTERRLSDEPRCRAESVLCLQGGNINCFNSLRWNVANHFFFRTLAVDLRIDGGGSPFSLTKHRGCPKARVVVISDSVRQRGNKTK